MRLSDGLEPWVFNPWPVEQVHPKAPHHLALGALHWQRNTTVREWWYCCPATKFPDPWGPLGPVCCIVHLITLCRARWEWCQAPGPNPGMLEDGKAQCWVPRSILECWGYRGSTRPLGTKPSGRGSSGPLGTNPSVEGWGEQCQFLGTQSWYIGTGRGGVGMGAAGPQGPILEGPAPLIWFAGPEG